jgi:phenylalanyl-tRNA synthetase alpha chain
MSVGEEIDSLERETLVRVPTLTTEEDLEQLRIEVLGRKGAITGILRGLKDVAAEERPVLGDRANAAKRSMESAIDTALVELRAAAENIRIESERIDVSLPAARWPTGHLHPLQQSMTEAIAVLEGMGFEVADGPEMEDDEHNFEALNFAPDHPARDMADTFLLEDGRLLRTHTSPIQVREMRKRKPPLAVIAPGATYRRDDDATHLPMFHQIEAFLVDTDIRFSDLKGVLEEFLGAFFGKVGLRFRASYFPFVEPGAEVDIACVMCSGAGSGCRVCSNTGWLEILGAGMIHPNVLRSVGYDPSAVSGFAFGVGVERLAMLRHAIDDMRLLVENDLRFLRQF